jgi:predicted AAA+ superfamily ATPase
VRIFDASLARVNTNPKKIYCVDHTLVTSISFGIIVTRNEEEQLPVLSGKIDVVPAWRFLLNHSA